MARTVISDLGTEMTFDDHGNLTHYKNVNGHEWWFEYDSSGREIHWRDSAGNEEWCEYDVYGNLKHWYAADWDLWYDFNGNSITKEEYDKLHAA